MYQFKKRNTAPATQPAKKSGAMPITDNRPKTIVQKKSSPAPAAITTVQKKSNHKGLPENLKSGIENLSGIAMDDVKVHYNSSQPGQLQAHAYAQGSDIHVAPGQEKHLPHEAWHVVQQKQRRVRPTKQLKSKVNINDDKGLEHEADIMGAKALQARQENTQLKKYSGAGLVVQRITMAVGDLQEAAHNKKQLNPEQHEHAKVITDAEANYRKKTKEKQVHPWDERTRPFYWGPLANIGREGLRIYGHGQIFKGDKSISMVGGYTPGMLAEKLVEMGLPSNYTGEIYLTGCETAIGPSKGFLGKFYNAIKQHCPGVTVRGNTGTAVTLPDGSQGVWTGVIPEEKYQRQRKVLNDKKEQYLEKNRVLANKTKQLLIDDKQINAEYERLMKVPVLTDEEAAQFREKRSRHERTVQANQDAIMEVNKFINLIVKAIKDLDAIAYDFTGRLSVTLPASLNEVRDVRDALSEAEDAEKLHSAKLEIAEELADMYGWSERTKTEKLYTGALDQRAAIRVRNQQEETPSYIS